MGKLGQFAKDYLRSYLELPNSQPKIVCIGGGTGMPTLLSGLKKYTADLTAIVTMADEGGSTGRLRRLMGVPAVGDIRKCLSALADEEEIMTKLLDYRFKGERYDDRDDALGGHSFGNLFLSALTTITGDFDTAMEEAAKLLKIKGRVLPSTKDDVHIWATTDSGEAIYGEANIDLGNYDGNKTIAKLHLEPESAKGYELAIRAIMEADLITAGPGDLYTSIMPNLLVKDIVNAINKSPAKKVFIINIANKPFETPQYTVSDYLKAVESHTGSKLFTTLIVNNNLHLPIPKEFNYYSYVKKDTVETIPKEINIIEADVVDESFPLRHDPAKLANLVVHLLKL